MIFKIEIHQFWKLSLDNVFLIYTFTFYVSPVCVLGPRNNEQFKELTKMTATGALK